MRFVRLELRDYGPFRDAPPIEFGEGPRLHVIQGPNEAGKSTALRAIRALLFGFPHSTGDVHERKYEELRIAATLRGEDGSELAFTRRKATVKPIWTIDDSHAIAAGSLAPFLGGLSESRFNDLFAMDHAELVEGGRAILDGKGDLGAILFAAGSGLARFDQVSRSLDDEIGKLFKLKASNPSINASLATLKLARDEENKSMLPTQKWADLHAELLREKDCRAQADAKIRSIESKIKEFENMIKSFPVIREREQVLIEIERSQDVILLAQGFAELRLKTSMDRQAALGQRDEMTVSIEKSRVELEAFGPPDAILNEAETIGELEVSRKLYLKASRDRQAKQVKLGLIEAEVRALLADLLPGRPKANADEVRGIVARRELIRELTGEHAKLAAKAQALEDAVGSTVSAHPGVLECPNDHASAREAGALAEALKRIGTFGDLDAQRIEALAELAEADRAATIGLAALPLWSGTLDDLLTLKIPMLATLDRSERDFREADDAAHRTRSLVDQAEAEASNLDVEIARFRLEGQVPSLEDLMEKRSDRDIAWRALRDRWLAGDRPDESADAFEGRIIEADAIADRLRLEADRVARHARLLESRRELADRLVVLSEARDRSIDRRSSLESVWQSLWASTGIVPLSPREMKDWSSFARANVVRQAEAVAKAREKVVRIDEKIESSRIEIGRHLSKLAGSSTEPESLVALIARARATADRVLVAARLVDDRAKLAKAEAAVDGWRSRWSTAVDALGLGLDVSANRANSVLDRLEKLLKAFEDQNSLTIEIADLERSESLFINDVQAMLKRLDLSPSATNVESEARALKTRLDKAKADDARRLAASERLEADRAKLNRALADLARADSALGTLVAEAGCASPDDLPRAERASDEAKSVRARLVELDRQVATLASPIPADRFLVEAGAVDGETLKSTIDDLATELDPLVAARTRHDQRTGALEQQLESLSVDQKAADARQSVHQSLARLSTDVERYARLKLASAVLKDAVERHRKRNQGPVLDRAGALFRALTAGSFAGLRDDLDDAGKPRLQGLRADGKTLLDVGAMSEGTADQLYLALRLASLGAYLDDHEPMPLVVDDILVNFDDVRARAALRALAELAGRTQVLFFTHHDHLVDLARDAVDPARLVVHRLVGIVAVAAEVVLG